MNDDGPKGCFYAIIGFIVLAMIGVGLARMQSPPDSGPSCLEVYERVRARGWNATRQEEAIMDRCDRALREERPPGGPYG